MNPSRGIKCAGRAGLQECQRKSLQEEVGATPRALFHVR